jgi:hypothetical protein
MDLLAFFAFVSTWFPLAASGVGLCLLLLIYRQTRMPKSSRGRPVADPSRIPSDRCVRRKTVKIADWADERNRISNVTFEDCMIEGPAVLATTGPRPSHIDSPTFAESSLPVMVAPDGYTTFGALGLDGVIFHRCFFRRVGITTTTEVAAKLRASVRPRPSR